MQQDQSAYQKHASSAATVGLILSVIVLFRRQALIATGPVGIALQVIAALLMIWARVSFGLRSFHFTANTTSGGLVTSGSYHWLRHPIYAAVLLFIWTGVLSTGLRLLSVAVAILATIMSAIRIRTEENFLRKEYEDYARYERTTKRLIPFVF